MFGLPLIDLIVYAVTILGIIFTGVMAALKRGTVNFCRKCATASILIGMACCALYAEFGRIDIPTLSRPTTPIGCFLVWFLIACFWLKRAE